MTSYPHNPLERYLEHYPVTGGTDLAILRIHLLVEELLFAIISQRFPYPKRLEQARLTFSQKICLAKASLQYGGSDSWIWGAIESLNAARTAMAHHLDPARTEAKTSSFVKLVDAATEGHYPSKPQDAEPLLWAGFVLHGELARMGDVKGERRNALADLLISSAKTPGPVRLMPE